MYKDYKVGDKVRLISVEEIDTNKGIRVGDVLNLTGVNRIDDEVCANVEGDPDDYFLYMSQIELVQLLPPTQFNFITKRQIAEHLQNVITFYEDYTSDLLKETARDYNEDIIDLKETGYEFRLELDKILIQVEEELL